LLDRSVCCIVVTAVPFFLVPFFFGLLRVTHPPIQRTLLRGVPCSHFLFVCT
jgi:hypothetical protein